MAEPKEEHPFFAQTDPDRSAVVSEAMAQQQGGGAAEAIAALTQQQRHQNEPYLRDKALNGALHIHTKVAGADGDGFVDNKAVVATAEAFLAFLKGTSAAVDKSDAA